MSSSLHRMGTLLGLVLVLWGGLSWGQLPEGNDTSDGQGNTGGGSGALLLNATGEANTAYGRQALVSNTTGGFNTAYGAGALGRNPTGANNIAIGFQAGFQSNGNAPTAVTLNGTACSVA